MLKSPFLQWRWTIPLLLLGVNVSSSFVSPLHCSSPISRLALRSPRTVAAPSGHQISASDHTPLQMGSFAPNNVQEQQEDSSSYTANKMLIWNLKQIYKDSVLPIERKFELHSFLSGGKIRDAELDARPMVLLIGQYSTGKTTFIRHLLGGKDFPGMHIGPEPTTDKFMALIHGENDNEEGNKSDDSVKNNLMGTNTTTTSLKATTSAKGKIIDDNPKDSNSFGKTIKGNSLTVIPELPFATLSQFGSSFLNNFVGSITDAPLLKSVTLVDTPGVLSGEKQRLNRSYDFAKTTKWFADRSDLILLLFDADKLDISDELKEVVSTIRMHNNDKIRCILNKADGVSREQLVRVYGSLMWSMGKLFPNPEVVRVYTGSFWDEPLVHDDFEEMFQSDESLLLRELTSLPDCAAERKVNAMVQRIRLVKVYICLLDHLRRKSRGAIRKERTQRRLISNLKEVFEEVQIKYNLPKGDMPNIEEFSSRLEEIENFSTFPKVSRQLLSEIDELIIQTIPAIMEGSVGVTNEKL